MRRWTPSSSTWTEGEQCWDCGPPICIQVRPGRALTPVEPVVRRPRPRIPWTSHYGRSSRTDAAVNTDAPRVFVAGIPDRFTVRSWLYRTELPSWCRPIPSGTLSTRKAPPAPDRWPGAASSPRWSRSSPRTCSRSMPAGLTPPRSWLRCSASVETRCTADPSRLSSAASSAATLRSPVAGSTDRPDQDHPQPRPVAGQRPCEPR